MFQENIPIKGKLDFLKNLNLNNILDGTQKTLNIVNQAIPIVKQVSPVMKNAKTMFRIMNEFKKVDTPTTSGNSNNVSNTEEKNAALDEQRSSGYTTTNNGPTFFI